MGMYSCPCRCPRSPRPIQYGMAKHRVLLLGAGKIGGGIAKLLASSGDYDVLVGDADEKALARIADAAAVAVATVDAGNESGVRKLLAGRDAVISACSYNVNPTIARAAAAAGVSYFDLTEDVETTKLVREIAKDAAGGQVFIPQCGLAPGFVSIAAYDLARKFDKLD